MTATVFDERRCRLGEGPLWHPLRNELFWFDILENCLLSKTSVWEFEKNTSAAGWVDHDRLLVADERSLFILNLETDSREHVIDLEADDPVTRSNDGRADPWGGFWIGTMGRHAEADAGAIYRYYQGELRRLVPNVTISNSICFAPDKSCAYFTDTIKARIMRQPLHPESGWPEGAPAVFVDLKPEGLNPDGSVVDSEGCLWNAQWGAQRVARYGANGSFTDAISFPAAQISCPAFGGAGFSTLFVTSAAIGADQNDPQAGQTFAIETQFKGLPEYQVVL